jgi:hypothetical protein
LPLIFKNNVLKLEIKIFKCSAPCAHFCILLLHCGARLKTVRKPTEYHVLKRRYRAKNVQTSIVERGKIDTSNTQIYDRLLSSWLDTGTSIKKSGGDQLVFGRML